MWSEQITLAMMGYFTTAKLHNSARQNKLIHDKTYISAHRQVHRFTKITLTGWAHPSIYKGLEGVQIRSCFDMLW